MRVFRLIEGFHGVLGVLSGVAILLITLIVVADVSLRTVFNAPVRGATESSTLLMVAMVYLGLAAVQRNKANFRVEIVVNLLPGGARRALDAFTTLLSVVVIALLAWHNANEAIAATRRGEMSVGAITFPVWPARIIIAFGLFTLLMQLLIDMVRLVLGHPPPGAASGRALDHRAGAAQ